MTPIFGVVDSSEGGVRIAGRHCWASNSGCCGPGGKIEQRRREAPADPELAAFELVQAQAALHRAQERDLPPRCGSPHPSGRGARHDEAADLVALRSQAGSAGSDPCRLLILADDSVVEK